MLNNAGTNVYRSGQGAAVGARKVGSSSTTTLRASAAPSKRIVITPPSKRDAKKR
ncbi:hypothetical protein JCM11754A_30680 [Isoptericola variabilis]